MILFLSPSVYWVVQDHSVWPWDQAWYGEVSTDLWFTMINSPGEWWPSMWKAFGIKAPGIAWVGQWFVPISRTLGSIEVGLLLSIILTQFGTLLLIYKIGKELLPDGELALLGPLMLMSAPLFIAMSHQYVAEPLQLFAVTYIFWIAARVRFWPGTQVIGHLFLASGLGLASKVTFPLYCFIPGCIALYDARKVPANPNSTRSIFKLGLLILAGVAVLGNVLVWYVKNGRTLLGFAKLSSSGDVALDYGKKESFFYKLQYWLSALQKSVALPYVLLGFGVLFAVILVIRFSIYKRMPSSQSRPSLLVIAAFAQVMVVLIT